MTMRYTCLVALMVIYGTAVADENDGWFKLGEALAGGTQAERDAAYLEGRRLGEEIRARQAKMALREAETNYQHQMSRIQVGLQQNWELVGYSSEEAQEIAYAYRDSQEEGAVFSRVRHRTDEQIGADIREALEDYDFLLANQLLLGWALKRQDTGMTSEE